jgi:hypothetical protein
VSTISDLVESSTVTNLTISDMVESSIVKDSTISFFAESSNSTDISASQQLMTKIKKYQM